MKSSIRAKSFEGTPWLSSIQLHKKLGVPFTYTDGHLDELNSLWALTYTDQRHIDKLITSVSKKNWTNFSTVSLLWFVQVFLKQTLDVFCQYTNRHLQHLIINLYCLYQSFCTVQDTTYLPHNFKKKLDFVDPSGPSASRTYIVATS